MGCEPSCLLTLRDEYPNLLNDEKSTMVADKAMLLEEFLDMLNREGRLNLSFKDTSNSSPRKMLFHSHCHARALVGTAPSLAAPAAGAQASRSRRAPPDAAAWPVLSATRRSTTTSP